MNPKIIHFSTGDISGGAARAAYRLHRAMLNKGTINQFLVLQKTTDDESVKNINNGMFPNIKQKVFLNLDQLPLYLYPRRAKHRVWHSGLFGIWQFRKTRYIQSADILMLYWTCGGFLSLKAIDQILQLKKPVIWRLSDMWPFTGGCHYSDDCRGFEHNCGRCPQLCSTSQSDLSHFVLSQKLKHWATHFNKRFVVVAPSRWIAKLAQRSTLFRKVRIEHIPTGVDLNVFKPHSKLTSRRILNLPTNKKLVLIGAYKGLSENRKGKDIFKEALLILSQRKNQLGKIEILVFGTWKYMNMLPSPFPIRPLGSFLNDLSLPLLYNACDVFVAPSLEDNLPNTVIEALACGTPAVAFNTGGLPEIIDHKFNGYLAKPFDPNDIANGISWVLNKLDDSSELPVNARNKAERSFNLLMNVQKFVDLHFELLQK